MFDALVFACALIDLGNTFGIEADGTYIMQGIDFQWTSGERSMCSTGRYLPGSSCPENDPSGSSSSLMGRAT